MKTLLILFVVAVGLSACGPQVPTIVPLDTAVAGTMAALPKTDTPMPAPINTPAPTAIESFSSPTPELPGIAGAECIPADAPREEALVTRVLDGDTIEVVIGNSAFMVEYLGVDAPEIVPAPQYFGMEAQAENKRLVSGRRVILVPDNIDTNGEGHLLRYVMTDDMFINHEMIQQGFARFNAAYPNLTCQTNLVEAESASATGLLGMWESTPTATATETPTPTATPEESPTPTSPPPCSCAAKNVSCNSFSSQSKAQACFEYCKDEGFGDIFGIDKNNNGLACEGMP